MSQAPREDGLKRGGSLRMSPSPFRGVLTLEAQDEIPHSITTGPPFQQQQQQQQQQPPPLNDIFSSSPSKFAMEASTNPQDAALSKASSAAASAAAAAAAATGNDTATALEIPTASLTASTIPDSSPILSNTTSALTSTTARPQTVRSRKPKPQDKNTKRRRRRRTSSKDYDGSRRSAGSNSKPTTTSLLAGATTTASLSSTRTSSTSKRRCCQPCCQNQALVRSTLSCMNLLARILFWSSAVASVAAVVWYSYELIKHGTDPHLIAWFSAGAFVILGFPISMYGIILHLANYNQPNVQMYIVRILWMVPIYSIESWLCLRYKDYAIYIETLRDVYESYVLYSFLQFLIQVLGGEETLILMLKDKSPTRGVHMWGLQWCVKPWLMGQPLRKTYDHASSSSTARGRSKRGHHLAQEQEREQLLASEALPGQSNNHHLAIATTINPSSSPRPLKRVHWTSPFFVKCKFGVLQYVLLKFVCAILVMVLERYGMYKEGDFTPKGGYLYICILTNLSQCWALYCLIFFYFATKNELGSIRPVGKFLSVKALVFFTWWQSVMISILYQMDLIPYYISGIGVSFGAAAGSTSDADSGMDSMPLSVQDALTMDEFGGSILGSVTGSKQQEWSAEDVAKGIQDYLICIEMFVAALVHIFVFPHTEYYPQAVEARTRALNQTPHKDWEKRLGRKWKEWDNKSGWSVSTNTSSDVEMSILNHHNQTTTTTNNASGIATGLTLSDSIDEEDDLRIHPLDRQSRVPSAFHDEDNNSEEEHDEGRPLLSLDTITSDVDDNDENAEDDGSSMYSLDSSELHDVDSYQGDEDLEQPRERTSSGESLLSISGSTKANKPGFVKAFLDSAIPQDLRDNTVGIIKGDYVVEKKTLLHHAATSDSYDLFSRVNKARYNSNSSKTSKS